MKKIKNANGCKDEMIDFFVLFLFIIIAIIFLLVVISMPVKIHQYFMPSVEVSVDGKTVFRGSSAGIDIISSGCATTVRTKKWYCYIMPDAIYTSKDVVIKPLK